MGNVSKARYCARGERCVRYDPHRGKAERLSQYNKDTICRACQEARLDVELQRVGRIASAPDERKIAKDYFERVRSEGKKFFPSSELNRFLDLKQQLVAQLSTRRGLFWDAVREMRARWGIEAEIRIPPATIGAPSPAGTVAQWTEGMQTIRDDVGRGMRLMDPLQQWNAELRTIRDRVIPEKYHRSLSDWWEAVIAKCVFYHPPETSLLEFAEVLGTPMVGFGRLEVDDELPPVVASPIRVLRDPDKVEEDTEWFWARVMGELENRLKPLGVDIGPILKDIWGAQDLWNEYVERVGQNQPRYYIEVDENTTKKDVLYAWGVIRPTTSQGGRPPGELLVDIECARLHEDGCTDKEIAERYGWQDTSVVKKHIKRGQNTLSDPG